MYISKSTLDIQIYGGKSFIKSLSSVSRVVLNIV